MHNKKGNKILPSRTNIPCANIVLLLDGGQPAISVSYNHRTIYLGSWTKEALIIIAGKKRNKSKAK